MPWRELVSRGERRLALSGGHVDYVLVRRRGRRGVGLKVDETGLTVSAPVTMPVSQVEALVRESERWVLRKIAEWSTRRAAPLEWIDGARLPFLGGALVLRFAEGARARAVRVGNELHVTVRALDAALARQAVVRWYKRSAQDYLEERVRSLAAAAGLAFPRVVISPALARWGSCNSRREIRLAWRLVKAPVRLVDYVICHELAHLRHMNHSRAFWAEVARQCPGYKRLRDELCATDHLYRTF
jgi:predicted metal-dependent hydrolase